MPVAVWKAMIKHHHGESGFALLHNDTLQSLMDYKRARGLHSFDACVARHARARARRRRGGDRDEPDRPDHAREPVRRRRSRRPRRILERLVDSLLFEGYALYPYTPGSTKNATPTPFGIVYPHDYAQNQNTRLRPHADAVRGRDRRRSSAARSASCRRPATSTRPSSGACRSASRRRRSPFDFDDLEGIAVLDTETLPDGRARLTLKVENVTPLTEEEATGVPGRARAPSRGRSAPAPPRRTGTSLRSAGCGAWSVAIASTVPSATPGQQGERILARGERRVDPARAVVGALGSRPSGSSQAKRREPATHASVSARWCGVTSQVTADAARRAPTGRRPGRRRSTGA